MSRRYCVIPRAVVISGNRLLLVRAEPGRYSPSAGRWHLPGGAVDEGESPQRAACRRVQEITRLEVGVEGCIDVLARRGPDPSTGRQTHLLHVFFRCRPAESCRPDLLPGGGGPELGLAASAGMPDADIQEAGIPGVPAPQGLTWGWTDLESGLAALRHDAVTRAVVNYLQQVRAAD